MFLKILTFSLITASWSLINLSGAETEQKPKIKRNRKQKPEENKESELLPTEIITQTEEHIKITEDKVEDMEEYLSR